MLCLLYGQGRWASGPGGVSRAKTQHNIKSKHLSFKWAGKWVATDNGRKILFLLV